MSNNKNTISRRVVVTGLGPLSAIGCGRRELWDSILKERINLKKKDYFVKGELWDSFLLHKIDDFDINKFKIDPAVINELSNWKEGRQDLDLLYALAATKLAIDDSALTYDKKNNNISLFLTVEHPGFEPFIDGMVKEALEYLGGNLISGKEPSKLDIYRHLYSKCVDHAYDLHTFIYLYLLAKAFGIHGYSLFTNNACASRLFAIEAAAKQIKYGGSSVAIVVAGDDPCTMFKHKWFKERNLYSEDGKIKPFSKSAKGIVFGEGYSAIILEDYEHALKRNAHIYAEYLGGAFNLEGWKVVFPDIGGTSYQKMIKECFDNCSVDIEQVDLINSHGVGIRITDGYEAKAVSEVFKESKPPVTAFKPFVGHNLGGSAILETIILILALENSIIPPTLNCEDFDQNYNINLVRSQKKHPLETVMKLSCGFAGYNGAAIFKKHA